MGRGIVKLPTASGVGAGQTATLNVPLGPTYHQLVFYVEDGGSPVSVGSWGSTIDEIRLAVNGSTKWRASGSFAETLAAYYGQNLDAGYLPIFFSRPWMRQAVEEDYLAWGTKDVQSFGIEVDFAAGATNPSMDVHALSSGGRKLGQHVTLRRYSVNVGVTGEVEISDIPKGAYGTMAFHLASADTDDFEVVTNGVKFRDADKALAEFIAKQTGGAATPRVPQAGFTHYDFMERNRLTDALSMDVQDFRLKVDFTATGNFYLYQEAVEGRPAEG